MSVSANDVFKEIAEAGVGTFWKSTQDIPPYLEKELSTMADTVAEIADNVAKHQKDPAKGYSASTGKRLLEMQVLSVATVIDGSSEMVTQATQDSINSMLKVVNKAIGGALSAVL